MLGALPQDKVEELWLRERHGRRDADDTKVWCKSPSALSEPLGGDLRAQASPHNLDVCVR
jgi:hypothetical protein